jgi:DNA (cytosine-5)-methyltransferase 1
VHFALAWELRTPWKVEISMGVKRELRFIDLFAGIGGMRLAFESAGARCVYTSEWNAHARQTYEANHIVDHEFAGDITKVNASSIPDHDILVGGFPCQPFSVAGVSKKQSLGRAHGFLDETQGTLFFDIARILEEKRPGAFLLENVRNLRSHDGGRTIATIRDTLELLGYEVSIGLVSSAGFVPQKRERVLIAGFDRHRGFDWNDFPSPAERPTLGTILHPENGSEPAESPYTSGDLGHVGDRYVLSPKLWNYLQDYKIRHRAQGNGFGYGLAGPDDQARTLSARYYKDGAEILIRREGFEEPRRLTPREAARLMGYKDSFILPKSDVQAYKQLGNSVVVPVIAAAASMVVQHALEESSLKVA